MISGLLRVYMNRIVFLVSFVNQNALQAWHAGQQACHMRWWVPESVCLSEMPGPRSSCMGYAITCVCLRCMGRVADALLSARAAKKGTKCPILHAKQGPNVLFCMPNRDQVSYSSCQRGPPVSHFGLSDAPVRQDVVERAVVLGIGANQQAASPALSELLNRYAGILAAQGRAATALDYLNLVSPARSQRSAAGVGCLVAGVALWATNAPRSSSAFQAHGAPTELAEQVVGWVFVVSYFWAAGAGVGCGSRGGF
jgi:hypothetical protein